MRDADTRSSLNARPGEVERNFKRLQFKEVEAFVPAIDASETIAPVNNSSTSFSSSNGSRVLVITRTRAYENSKIRGIESKSPALERKRLSRQRWEDAQW